jgi:MscS family membrane protein
VADWLRDILPEWLLDRAFLLENWQWLAVLLLVLVGVIAGILVRVILFGVGGRIARARGVQLESEPKRGRPFSLVAQAVLWLVVLPLLDLPEKAVGAMFLAARFVLMVGIVWAACQVIDWLAALLQGMAKRTDTRLDDLLVPMFRKALKIFVVAFGVVWIAGNLDMDIGALLAGLGIGGVAIALAGKDTVENLFGAMAIVADRPFQVGDWIRLGKIEGTVEEVGFRSTRVRTFYNSLISFPNAMLIRQEVDNLGVREWRRIKTTIGVCYDTPPTKLEAFVDGIREIIRRHPYTRKDYYHVYFNGFGDSSLEILLYLFVKTPDWGTELREKHRFFLDILRLAGELGVEFAFPTRTLHMIESRMPDHGRPPASVREARRGARATAREIVDEFTGPGIPPPVVISERPDDDAEGSGES